MPTKFERFKKLKIFGERDEMQIKIDTPWIVENEN